VHDLNPGGGEKASTGKRRPSIDLQPGRSPSSQRIAKILLCSGGSIGNMSPKATAIGKIKNPRQGSSSVNEYIYNQR